MKNILIINLRRIGDVYTTGHLLNSLTKHEGNSVSLLVYKESAKAAANLKNISTLHTIDRKEIITLKSNKLFSDGFAIDQLYTYLQPIKNQKWDEIINYSNDLVGSYICSYLKDSSKKITGVHFNQNRNVVTSSDWEILFNDVLPVVKYAPMHFVDCYHKIIGINASREGEKLITNTDHNETAFNNMNVIRKAHGGNESSAKIVGIQLKTADRAKDIPQETIIEFLKLTTANPDFIPVLLIAPTEDERRCAAEINTQFNNEIVVIEADLQAVASVLMNIDILVTPDTAIKHIADLTETPVVEISLGHAPFLKQGSYSPGSLILTDLIIERNFTRGSDQDAGESMTNIKAQDIMAAVGYYFSKTKSIRPKLTSDVTLYTSLLDQLGVRYAVVAGTVDTQTEIHRLMSRQLINVVYDQNESNEIY
ncbi:MAG: lipopolysaccharide heptosyltransferase family protein, partial [Alphaproteobacteria bacterium]